MAWPKGKPRRPAPPADGATVPPEAADSGQASVSGLPEGVTPAPSGSIVGGMGVVFDVLPAEAAGGVVGSQPTERLASLSDQPGYSEGTGVSAPADEIRQDTASDAGAARPRATSDVFMRLPDGRVTEVHRASVEHCKREWGWVLHEP